MGRQPHERPEPPGRRRRATNRSSSQCSIPASRGTRRSCATTSTRSTSENALDCKSIIRDYGLGFLTDNGILDECRNGDTDGHGTWVASRIGAAANGFGSNGVAPKVTIRSYKVLAGDFGGLTSWIVDGMVDACHDGADILNMSIVGYDDPTLDSDAQDYLLWADAVKYCQSRGTVIVASAGNDHVRLNRVKNITVAGRTFAGAGQVAQGSEGIGTVYPGDSIQPYIYDLRGMLLVPGGLPGVILVSATSNEVVNAAGADPSVRWPAKWIGARDQLAYYSNYGSRIDIAAPGGARKFNIPLFDGGPNDILADGYGTFSAVDPNSAYCTDPDISASYNSACFTIDGQGFAWSQGTSMAAPDLSGVAVLVLAAHPELRGHPGALLARLQATARTEVVNYTGPNDPNNTTPAIDGTPCDTGYCHLDFKHPISSTMRTAPGSSTRAPQSPNRYRDRTLAGVAAASSSASSPEPSCSSSSRATFPFGCTRLKSASVVSQSSSNTLGARRAGELEVLLEQCAQVRRGRFGERLGEDEVGVHADLQAPVRVVDERLAAAHAGTEVAPEVAQDDHCPGGHVLAGMLAGALDHGDGARVADGEALADAPGDEEPTAGRSVEQRVPGQNWMAGHVGRRPDDDRASVHALADVVVGRAGQLEGDSVGQVGAEALSRRALEANEHRSGRRAEAEALADVAAEAGAHGAVAVADLVLELDLDLVLENLGRVGREPVA